MTDELIQDQATVAELSKKIDKAKMQIMMSSTRTTFFSALLANLRIQLLAEEKANRGHTTTAATDGKNLWFAGQFVKSITQEQLMGLMLHEVLHVAHEDMFRAEELDLDKRLWNQACDHAINLWLTMHGFKLPPNGLCDRRFTGMSRMEIYLALQSESQDDDDDSDQETDWGADLVDGEGMPSEELNELKQDIKNAITQAVLQAEIAKDYGSVPGEIQRKVEAWLNPKLPWQTILHNHFNSKNGSELNWKMPNRRYWPSFYVPRSDANKLGPLISAMDASGSITQEDWDSVMTEVKYLWEVFKPSRLELMSWDTQINNHYVIEEGEDIGDYKFEGGGGTNVQPLLDYLANSPSGEGVTPGVAIIFTDLEFAMPDCSAIAASGMEIIWLIKGNAPFQIPYGIEVRF